MKRSRQFLSDGTDDELEPFRTERMADVKAERVSWLWRGRIPLGKVTLIEGDPGLGKSTVTLDLAARVSTGAPMPFEDSEHDPADVLLMSSEDGLGDTVRPRLEAAGADTSRVHAVSIIESGDQPSFPSAAYRLERTIKAFSARLVLIDPLMAFFDDGTDTNKDASVRLTMAALSQVAQRTGSAIVVVRHLNKGVGKAAMYRGGGSIGIIAATRSALLIEKSPSNPAERVVARTKGNLSAEPRAVSFRLVTTDDVARVEWVAELDAGVTADTLLAANAEPTVRRESEVDRAAAFARAFLEAGPVLSTELDAAALEAGFSVTGALKRAKERLGIKARKTAGGRWVSFIPQGEDEPAESQEEQEEQHAHAEGLQ